MLSNYVRSNYVLLNYIRAVELHAVEVGAVNLLSVELLNVELLAVELEIHRRSFWGDENEMQRLFSPKNSAPIEAIIYTALLPLCHSASQRPG
jgi:hypothetical protein